MNNSGLHIDIPVRAVLDAHTRSAYKFNQSNSHFEIYTEHVSFDSRPINDITYNHVYKNNIPGVNVELKSVTDLISKKTVVNSIGVTSLVYNESGDIKGKCTSNYERNASSLWGLAPVWLNTQCTRRESLMTFRN
jgi:hypothetical protein